MSTMATRGVLLALSVLVLLLVRETRSLRHAAAAAEAERWSAAVGMYVPPFAAAAEDGRSITVGQPDALAQLVILFSTECEYSLALRSGVERTGRAYRSGEHGCGCGDQHGSGARIRWEQVRQPRGDFQPSTSPAATMPPCTGAHWCRKRSSWIRPAAFA
jgi:hypothetical protein